MRHTPNSQYDGNPCLCVAVGTAYEQKHNKDFAIDLEDMTGQHSDGYMTLNDGNKFIRKHLNVEKRRDYKRGERPLLKDFLQSNEKQCIICVYGHYLYADKQDYWSFFDNEYDEVVAVWYLK